MYLCIFNSPQELTIFSKHPSQRTENICELEKILSGLPTGDIASQEEGQAETLINQYTGISNPIKDLFHTRSSAGNWILRIGNPWSSFPLFMSQKEAVKIDFSPDGKPRSLSLILVSLRLFSLSHAYSLCVCVCACVPCINETLCRCITAAFNHSVTSLWNSEALQVIFPLLKKSNVSVA